MSVSVDLMTWAARCIQMIADEFEEPDADFAPVMLVHSRDNRGIVVGFDPAFLNGGAEGKRAWITALHKVLEVANADACAVITSTWMADFKAGDTTAPSDRTDRREAVMVTLVSATEARVAWWPILRDPKLPPKLGDVTRATAGGGALADALKQALQ